MKSVYRNPLFAVVLCVMALATALSGCSREKLDGPVKVLLPWPTSEGTYSLQEIELNTLRDRYVMKGESAEIFLEPVIDKDRLRGTYPTARFAETDSGVLVPTDFMTMQVAGVYAHAEKLWELDKKMGVGDLLTRPRRYGLKVKSFDQITQSEQMKNNATYIEQVEGTLIMPFDPAQLPADKQLPLSLNAGILAHEHFHALFYRLIGRVFNSEVAPTLTNLIPAGAEIFDFTGSAVERKRAPAWTFNTVSLRALNEGLADLWGWIYTGDENFLSHSLPGLSESRKFNPSKDEVSLTTEWFRGEFQKSSERGQLGLAYLMGTHIARKVRRQAQVGFNDPPERRSKVAQNILLALPKIRARVERSVAEGREIELEMMLEELSLKAPQ